MRGCSGSCSPDPSPNPNPYPNPNPTPTPTPNPYPLGARLLDLVQRELPSASLGLDRRLEAEVLLCLR